MNEIKDIQASFISLCLPDHIFFMWTVDKFLYESEQMMAKLGYKLHARIIWNKQNGIAPAFTVRYGYEYLIVSISWKIYTRIY